MMLLRRATVIFLACCAPLLVFAAAAESPVPLSALDERAKQHVEALLKDHTLERSLSLDHPILNQSLHQFLLDRPDVGAAISRSLGIGNYTIRREGPDRFHGYDPDGVEGDMAIYYRDGAHRVYYAEGIAKGGLVTLRGKTVIFHAFQYRSAGQAQEWVQSRLTIYAKIENPVLAFVIKILEPFIGQLVDPRISKAQGVVKQVSEALVHDPHGTYGRIAASNELPPEDLKTLGDLMGPIESSPQSRINHPHEG
jgi:hypothetical protein